MVPRHLKSRRTKLRLRTNRIRNRNLMTDRIRRADGRIIRRTRRRQTHRSRVLVNVIVVVPHLERFAETAKIAVGGFVCRVVSHYAADGFAIAAEDTHGIHGAGFLVLEGASGLGKTEFASEVATSPIPLVASVSTCSSIRAFSPRLTYARTQSAP